VTYVKYLWSDGPSIALIEKKKMSIFDTKIRNSEKDPVQMW